MLKCQFIIYFNIGIIVAYIILQEISIIFCLVGGKDDI